MIFLSLIFYVKSILEDLEVLKLPFLPFLGSEFCPFGTFQPSKSAKMHKKSKFRGSKSVKMADFVPLEQRSGVASYKALVQKRI